MMKFLQKLTTFSIKHPKVALWSNVLASGAILLVVLLSLLFPGLNLNKPTVDTDPENMLAKTEAVRVFHNQMKQEFKLYDMLVVGVTKDKASVFEVDMLNKIYDLTEHIKTIPGVITKDLMSVSTVDSIEAKSQGVVNFHWLMDKKISNNKESQSIYQQAARIPFLNGTLVSEDGQALAIYVPLEAKNLSYKIASDIKAEVKNLGMDKQIFITGLPVAQDQFGVEMFKQMAISAPLAMLFIFILMYAFFRNLKLITSPMIVAMLSLAVTMGLLVITGNTLHIMSSMIPIFIMPIAVLDAVHILSDFFEEYQKFKDKEKAITHVMNALFAPMLYTSITTVVGFLSLATTPIPPVQVFGIFVALGVGFAWISTITFIPAYIMLMDERKLGNFGIDKKETHSVLHNWLQKLGLKTQQHYKLIIGLTLAMVAFAGVGISKININDNPIKWFAPHHEIRVADKKLNAHFAGTYMAYLALSSDEGSQNIKELALQKGFPADKIKGEAKGEILNSLYDFADAQKNADMWYKKIAEIEKSLQIFKNPEALAYIEKLQSHLQQTGLVGKSSSLADIVKTVHRDLYNGSEKYFSLPEHAEGIAQTLLTYQSSHRPTDLWHFVNADYSKANLWLQLKSGDNQDMAKVVAAVDKFAQSNPSSFNLKPEWFGMTYINVVWQDKMVSGMLNSFLGSFWVVLLLMTVLFGSIAWGLLSMLPLTLTIGFIYGLIGFIGKDYDMPIAVLSSLSLGLAVDYAIHFLARAREMKTEQNSWKEISTRMFAEPASAIFKNVIVVSIGFVPLLFAPLVPYQTVGIFISSILFFAGLVTMLVLPAIITMGQNWLFKNMGQNKMSNLTKISIIILVVMSLWQNFNYYL